MAAHRYWRLYLRHHASGYLGAANIEFRSSIGGADLCSGGTVLYSTQYNSTTASAANAFDSDGATEWATTSQSANAFSFIGYDFGAGVEVDIVEILWRASTLPVRSPQDFVLQYSDNGSAWVSYCAFLEFTAFASSYEEKTFALSDGILCSLLYSPTNMTSNSAPSPLVASGNSVYDGSTDYYKAFDSWFFQISSWVSDKTWTPSCYLQIDLGSGNEKDVASLGIGCSKDPTYIDRCPKDFTLSGSNDNTNWTTLVTVTDETFSVTDYLKFYDCSVTGTAFRYFRVTVTENQGGAFVHIGSVFLMGAPPSTTITATTGAVVLASVNASVSQTIGINCTVGEIAIIPINASVSIGTTMTAGTGAVTVAPVNADVSQTVSINCSTGAVAISGVAASVSTGITIAATTGAVVISGVAASISVGTTITGTTGAVVVAAVNASVTNDLTINGTTGAVAIAGVNAEVLATITIECTTGAVVISGVSANVSSGVTFGCATGGPVAIASVNAAVSVGVTITIDATTGVVLISGVNAAVSQEITFSCATGAVIIAGVSGSVWNGEVPAETIYSIPQENRIYSIPYNNRIYSIPE